MSNAQLYNCLSLLPFSSLNKITSIVKSTFSISFLCTYMINIELVCFGSVQLPNQQLHEKKKEKEEQRNRKAKEDEKGEGRIN